MPAPGPSDPNLLATLSFTRTGIQLMRRYCDGEVIEYAIDPKALTDLFSVQEPPPPPPTNNTDILLPSTVCIVMRGDSKTIVDYRAPQLTGIWFMGNPTPLRIPLPGLLLIKTTDGDNSRTKYLMFAVKERPTSMDCDLYETPLVHTYQSGGICWGNVTIAPETSPNSLANAWAAFLGTPFSNHNVGRKSRRKKYANDIRALLIDLDKRKARRYPVNDLVRVNTLKDVLTKGRYS